MIGSISDRDFKERERDSMCINNREMLTKESIIPNFFMIYRIRCQMIVQYKSYHLVVPAREQANLPVFNNNEKALYVSKKERDCMCVCM